MLYLKCTAEVQKAIGLKKDNLAVAQPSQALLGNWYVNRFDFDRRKAYVFMSETTLLSFVLFQGKRKVTAESLPNMLLAGLEQLLRMKNVPESVIDRVFEHYHEGLFAKTDSRQDLGSMNDLVSLYQAAVENDGGLAHCDLTEIIMTVNNTPQRRLDWKTSWFVVQRELGLFH